MIWLHWCTCTHKHTIALIALAHGFWASETFHRIVPKIFRFGFQPNCAHIIMILYIKLLLLVPDIIYIHAIGALIANIFPSEKSCSETPAITGRALPVVVLMLCRELLSIIIIIIIWIGVITARRIIILLWEQRGVVRIVWRRRCGRLATETENFTWFN